MKILYVITSLRTGGAEKLVVSLMPRLHSMGYKVGVVLFNGKRTALMKQLEVECPECEVYSLGDSFYNPFYIFKLIRIMRKKAGSSLNGGHRLRPRPHTDARWNP